MVEVLHKRRVVGQRRRDKQLLIEAHVPLTALQQRTNARREHDLIVDEKDEECCRQKEWFPLDGPLRYVWTYKQKVQHGRQQAWYENALQQYDWNYSQGEMHGRRRGWYEDGWPEYDNGHDRGRPHGRQQSWRKNCQPEWDENYERGLEHGSMRKWDAEGKLVRCEWYERGVQWDREAARQVVVVSAQDLMAAVLIGLVAAYV